MIRRARKRIQVRLKIKKNHMMVILVFMNAGKILPLNIQMRMHSNGFYHGYIHEYSGRVCFKVKIGL